MLRPPPKSKTGEVAAFRDVRVLLAVLSRGTEFAPPPCSFCHYRTTGCPVQVRRQAPETLFLLPEDGCDSYALDESSPGETLMLIESYLCGPAANL
jgi:hypothetical protein